MDMLGTLCVYAIVGLMFLNMSDVDFIRLSALVFATRLIGMTADPVSEGIDMAERLFDELKQRDV